MLQRMSPLLDPKRTFPSQRVYVTCLRNRIVYDVGVSLELTVGLYAKRRVTNDPLLS